MSFHVALVWSLWRSGLLAVIAVGAAVPVARWFRGAGAGTWRTLAATLIVSPLLMPKAVIAYAYSNSVLPNIRDPWLNEGLTFIILAMTLIPIAAGVLLFAPPPPLTLASRHLRRMLPTDCAIGLRRPPATWSFLLGGPLRTRIMAGALVFLLAFQEFEMTSLFRIRSWTVWLFDAQVGGLTIAESLRRTALPVAVQAGVLIVGLLFLLGRHEPRSEFEARPRCNRTTNVCVWVYLLASTVAICIIPLASLINASREGIYAMVSEASIAAKLMNSIILGVAATIGALAVARLCTWTNRRRLLITIVLCLPGLMGSLVLALFVVTLFQMPATASLYDTPLPVLLALVLLLLPVIILLKLVLDTAKPKHGLHLARLLGQSNHPALKRQGHELAWQLRGRAWWCVVLLLFLLAYLEFTASSILAPPSIRPATVLLYNQMHYGQSHMLSAMVCMLLLPPILLAVGSLLILKLTWRALSHG